MKKRLGRPPGSRNKPRNTAKNVITPPRNENLTHDYIRGFVAGVLATDRLNNSVHAKASSQAKRTVDAAYNTW